MKEVKNKRALLAGYSAVQAFYWAGACCIGGYAAVYLQSHGYTNSQLGMILALGNIGGFFLAPMLAGIIDRSEKVSVFTCMFGILLSEVLLELSLIFLPGQSIFIGIVFCCLIILSTAANPLNTDMCFALDHSGKYISYGISRSFGSLSYTVVTLALGSLCQSISPEILPQVGAVMALLQLAVLLYVMKLRSIYSREDEEAESVLRSQAVSLSAFIRNNKRFMVFCLGTMVLNFAVSVPSSFLINLIRSVGGNTADLGRISSLTAFAEVPAMLFYTRITKNIRCSTAIRVAVSAYVLKLLIYPLAHGTGILYAGCIFQTFSYALLTPALVDYSSIVVSYSDIAKSQAVSAAMLTLGSVFATQLGGLMLDALSVRTTMMIAFFFCIAGSAICFFAVDKRRA